MQNCGANVDHDCLMKTKLYQLSPCRTMAILIGVIHRIAEIAVNSFYSWMDWMGGIWGSEFRVVRAPSNFWTSIWNVTKYLLEVGEKHELASLTCLMFNWVPFHLKKIQYEHLSLKSSVQLRCLMVGRVAVCPTPAGPYAAEHQQLSPWCPILLWTKQWGLIVWTIFQSKIGSPVLHMAGLNHQLLLLFSTGDLTLQPHGSSSHRNLDSDICFCLLEETYSAAPRMAALTLPAFRT